MAATDFKDYYQLLGVNKSADANEIKKAFRRLARKYHPDMNPGDKNAEARFKEVSEAYEILSDPDKRRQYDQFGRYWKQAGGASAGGWPGGASTSADFGGFDFSQYSSFDEFVEALLGNMGGANGARSRRWSYSNGQPGAGTGGFGFSGFEDFASRSRTTTTGLDRETTLSLTFSEAFRGTQRQLNLGNETISVRIPPGAKTGTKVRVKGKGTSDGYGRRGDLYLKVELRPHSFFSFEGDNLVCEVPIAPDEAVLGAKIEVPTADGTVTVNVPAGVRSGQSLRLRGKGWPQTKGGGRSDQLVRLTIVPPKSLGDRERELYEQISQVRSSDPRRDLNNISL